MIRTGDREIHPLFGGRLPDNPGELAYMQLLEDVFRKLFVFPGASGLNRFAKVSFHSALPR